GPSFDATYTPSVGRSIPTYAGDTAARFASASDVVESLGVSSLTGNPTFTIETIINLDAAGSAGLWGPFLHWGDGGTQRNGREVYFSISSNFNNRIYAGFYNAGQRTVNNVPTGAWIHVVWVRQGGSATNAGTTLYINGQPVALEQDPALNPGVLPASG